MTATLILRAHGCPPQAIVAACGLDERTVRAWLHRAGAPCTRLHGHLIEAGQVAGGQVQADEIGVKVRGGVVWQAMALDVASRLWTGWGGRPGTRRGAGDAVAGADTRLHRDARDPALCRWVRRVRRRGARCLPGAGRQRQARASPVGVAGGLPAGPGRQKPQGAAAGGGHAARGRRHGGRGRARDRGDAGGGRLSTPPTSSAPQRGPRPPSARIWHPWHGEDAGSRTGQLWSRAACGSSALCL
jgi:hypothetical protein